MMKLLFLVAIIQILFISTNPAAGLLNLTKIGSTDFAYFDDIITYDYVLTNEEGVDLHDVVFTDDHFGSIAIGNLNSGATWTHSLNHQINESDMPSGPLVNNAWATGKRPDESVVTSPIATWYVSVTISGTLPVDIRPSAAFRPIGSTVTYTISVTNNYPVNISNISLINTLYHPSAIVRWVGLNRLNLTPGQKATGTLSYTVVQEDILGPPREIAGSGSPKIIDRADATGRLPWWNSANPAHIVAGGATNTIDVTYTTQQAVSKIANVTQGTINTRTTFNITVNNGGTVLLNRTELTDLLPKGLTFISASPAANSSTSNLNGTTTLYWSNLSQSFGRVLNPGKQFNVLVTAYFSGAKYGTLTNLVTSKGYNLRRETITSSSTKDVTALNQNIAVVKTADIASGSPGTPVNFTLNVNNTGGLTLEHVFVSDLLPSGMSYVSSSPGSTNSGPNVYWSDIGPIAINAHKLLWVRALIDNSIVGNQTLTNRVDVNGKPDIGTNVTNSSNASVDAHEAKILVTKKANPTTGSPGASVTFTLFVNNTGSAVLQDVFVSDLLPAGMTYVSSSPAGRNIGQTVSWSNIGPMSSGQNKSLQIVATIDNTITGNQTLTNNVDVSGKPANGNNVTSQASADVQAREAKILVTKKANPTSGSPGASVTFTLFVNNTGSSALQDVFVSDLLPVGMTYVSSSPAGRNVGQTVYWSNIGPMSSGQNKSLQIVATIDNTITGNQTLTNNVDVSGKPANGNNVTSQASADVQAREAKILVTKEANPTSGSPGTSVTFTLFVNNTGSSALQDVFVSDLLPVGMTYVSSSPAGRNVGQTVYWSNIGPMSSGQNKSLQIVATIDNTITGNQTLTNNVDVSGKPANGNNVTSQASADVQAREAKILVTKKANPTTGSPGASVTFTLFVNNTGSSALQDVFVSDLLPAGMTYVSSSPAGRNVGQTVSWSNIGPMSSGQNKSLQIVATIDNTITGNQTLTNNVDVSGKPANGNNVTSQASADVQAREAKILVTKKANPTTGSPGASVTFTLFVNNTGSSALQDVFVSDLLPAGMTYVSSSPAGRNVGQTVSWSNIGPMSSGQNKSLQIVATIDNTITGNQTLTNNVDVSGKPANGNNVTSQASADVQAREAKILVTKKANPTIGSPGASVTFTLFVNNTGGAALQDVFVSDLLPVGMTYVSSSPAGRNVGQTVSWSNIGPMSSGQNKSLQIVATIDNTITGNQTLTNNVDVSGKPANGNNVTSQASADVQARKPRSWSPKKPIPRPVHPARASPSLCSSIIPAAQLCRMSSSATFCPLA